MNRLLGITAAYVEEKNTVNKSSFNPFVRVPSEKLKDVKPIFKETITLKKNSMSSGLSLAWSSFNNTSHTNPRAFRISMTLNKQKEGFLRLSEFYIMDMYSAKPTRMSTSL